MSKSAEIRKDKAEAFGRSLRACVKDRDDALYLARAYDRIHRSKNIQYESLLPKFMEGWDYADQTARQRGLFDELDTALLGEDEEESDLDQEYQDACEHGCPPTEICEICEDPPYEDREDPITGEVRKA